MLSSQELSVLVEREEKEWQHRQEERVEDEEAAEAERAAEEGPSPEQEYDEDPPTQNSIHAEECVDSNCFLYT